MGSAHISLVLPPKSDGNLTKITYCKRNNCSLFIFLSCVALSQQCTRHGQSCPNYTVIETHDEYEVRQYPSLVWVSTTGKAKVRTEITRKLIKRLYAYIGGENIKGQRMDMMVPIRTTKFPAEDENTYVMSIALAPEYQKDPPQPTNPLLKVVTEPERIYYTRSFGGFIREETRWDSEAEALRNSLDENLTANATFYYWGAYDPPWVPEEDRLNEVWLLPSENSTE